VVVAAPYPDGLWFEAQALQARVMQIDSRYPGVSAQVTARIGRARQVLPLDIAFGNVMVHRDARHLQGAGDDDAPVHSAWEYLPPYSRFRCARSRSSAHLPYVRAVCTSLCPRCSATSCSWKPARISRVPAVCRSACRPR
jgi:hypothetical protein